MFHFYLAQTPITDDGIAGVEYLKDGISQLIKLIDEVVDTHKAWGILQQTRGGIGSGFPYSKSSLIALFTTNMLYIIIKHDKKFKYK